jgi:probable DNA metabolism protein
MLAFRYDGTFDGLLCAVFDAYALKRFPGLVLEEDRAAPLTATTTHRVETDPRKADRVYSGLERRISPTGRGELMRVWCAETDDRADLLFRFMRLVFDTPEREPLNYLDPAAFAVRELARAVQAEAHLLRGFARFQQTAEGVYFCGLSPRYNVLPFLPGHFTDRMAGLRWILYDASRGYGLYHDTLRLHEVRMAEDLLPGGRLRDDLLADRELLFQTLWRRYFKAAAVPERGNAKLQARCLPRRFWACMTEKQPPAMDAARKKYPSARVCGPGA